MERRKIILFGKTAFCVTLPQAWVKKNNLHKGDSLSVQETARNSLELIPANVSLDTSLSIELPITDLSTERIISYLHSMYLNGYSIIILTGSNADKIAGIRKYVHELIATDIMEVTSNNIVINMLWDMTNMDLQNMISRINNILKAMFTETKELFGTTISSKDILEKSHEVTRQVLLTRRVITHALKDSASAQKFKFSTHELYYTSYFVYFLGKIGDFIGELSSRITAAKNNKEFNLEVRYSVEKLLFGISSYFESVMDTYYKHIKGVAFTIQHYEQFAEDINALLAHHTSDSFALADSMNLIMTKVHEAEAIIINIETAPK